MATTDNARATQTGLQTQVVPQANDAERFTQKVLAEFSSNAAGRLEVTEFQRQLIQGYFISITKALAEADDARLRKNRANSDRKYDNNLAVTWENVNLSALAPDIVHYARMGLDMMQSNHLFPIPYKNNKMGKYDMTLMLGYGGIRYIAEKYAIERPVAVTVELVYSTDKFMPIKKSRGNQVESYQFDITSPFARGEIIGGFGYIEYEDARKNELVIMSRQEIEKRKPQYASTEFWGGTKTEYKDGKPAGTVQVEGWLAQMCYKTLVREIYSPKHLPLDPQKVDDNYQHLRLREARYAEIAAQAEVTEFANTITIDTTMELTGDGEPDQSPEPPTLSPVAPTDQKPEQEASRKQTRKRPTEQTLPSDGPEF